MNKPKFLIIHHAYMTDLKDGQSTDRIKRYHTKVNGWDNIGYHYVLEYDKKKVLVQKGRLESAQGAHALKFNTKSLGICVVGNYDREELESDKFDTLVALCIHLCQFAHVAPDNIIGHRDTYIIRGVDVEKSCPGTLFPMNELRESVIAAVKKDNHEEMI